MADFREWLRRHREAAGLSQRKLAAAVGVDPSHVSHMESGARLPSVELLFEIARALGVERITLHVPKEADRV